jgi:hypothetical protein
MLYSCTVFVSVRTLFHQGKRLSGYAVKIQRPLAGVLVLEPGQPGELRARLVDAGGRDRLEWLDAAAVAASGARGMLIQGVQYRKKGRKHSIADPQAWWCEAPPVTSPLVDHGRRIAEVQASLERQARAGWGPD